MDFLPKSIITLNSFLILFFKKKIVGTSKIKFQCVSKIPKMALISKLNNTQ